MDWKTVLGSQEQRPEAVDTTSSPTILYLRKNIRKVNVPTSQTTIVQMWEYEELEVPKTDNGMHIALTDLMRTVDNQEVIMLALADIYEKLEER